MRSPVLIQLDLLDSKCLGIHKLTDYLSVLHGTDLIDELHEYVYDLNLRLEICLILPSILLFNPLQALDSFLTRNKQLQSRNSSPTSDRNLFQGAYPTLLSPLFDILHLLSPPLPSIINVLPLSPKYRRADRSPTIQGREQRCHFCTLVRKFAALVLIHNFQHDRTFGLCQFEVREVLCPFVSERDQGGGAATFGEEEVGSLDDAGVVVGFCQFESEVGSFCSELAESQEASVAADTF